MSKISHHSAEVARRRETALHNIEKHLKVAHSSAASDDPLVLSHKDEIAVLERRIKENTKARRQLKRDRKPRQKPHVELGAQELGPLEEVHD